MSVEGPICCHDSHTGDNELANAILVRDRPDTDIQVFRALQDVLVGKGSESKLLQCIVCIRNKLPKEDVPS